MPQWPVFTHRETELLRQVLASDQWGGFHEFVARLEREFAAFHGCQYGVSAANGTVALDMALRAAGIGPGDEVIVPAHSFVATATSVVAVGAVPVFVDLEPLTFNLDPQRVERAIGPSTKAILVVHFGGLIADMARLGRIAAERNLLLIEDAAHAHGAEWRQRRAGCFGIAGTFSFQNSKVMTAGEGGMVVTNDARLAGRAWSYANQGRRPGGEWFNHYTLGANYRLSAFQAAVLIAQLERLPAQLQMRERNARLLQGGLLDIEGLLWQQVPDESHVHSYYLVLGRIDEESFGMSRDAFCAGLNAEGIPATPFYPHPLYSNPLFERHAFRLEPCPVAEAMVRDAFWLSHRVLMGDEETTVRLAQAIRRVSGRVVKTARDLAAEDD